MPPKHSHEKFFRKFFQIYPRRLFADFLARICDEGKGCLLPAYGGGYPFFVGLWACCRFASFLFSLLLRLCRRLRLFRLLRSLFPCGLPFPIGWRHREHSGTIVAAGPVVFLVLLGGAWLPCLGPASVLPRSSREHQDHRQQGQRGCRSFLPLGPDWLIASAQLRQDLSTEIAPNEGKKG